MTEGLCTKCQKEFRIPGQRWGRGCRALYMRSWRKGADQRVLRRLLKIASQQASETP